MTSETTRFFLSTKSLSTAILILLFIFILKKPKIKTSIFNKYNNMNYGGGKPINVTNFYLNRCIFTLNNGH